MAECLRLFEAKGLEFEHDPQRFRAAVIFWIFEIYNLKKKLQKTHPPGNFSSKYSIMARLSFMDIPLWTKTGTRENGVPHFDSNSAVFWMIGFVLEDSTNRGLSLLALSHHLFLKDMKTFDFFSI